jgi:hypothetical protein
MKIVGLLIASIIFGLISFANNIVLRRIAKMRAILIALMLGGCVMACYLIGYENKARRINIFVAAGGGVLDGSRLFISLSDMHSDTSISEIQLWICILYSTY